MTARIIATVNRGMTDKTPVVVFPWEIPLLNEIHGDDACEVHDVEDLASMKGAATIVKLKLRHTEVQAPGLKEQLIAMQSSLPEDYDPFDAEAEYSRLENVYGMHPEVKMSLVEKVYGRLDSGNFKKKVQEVKDTLMSAASENLTGAEIRDLLRSRGVDFKTNTPVVSLKERLDLIVQLEELQIDFNMNEPIAKLKELVEAMA